jgi:branched-chain amino acid transport system permease protein
VAIGIVARALATLVWGPQMRYPLTELRVQDTLVRLPGNLVISYVDIASVLVSMAFFVGLVLLLQKTPLGVRMRAVAEKPGLAAYSGVNVHAILAFSWGLSTFAAIVGVMFYSSRLGLQPELWLIGLKAFVPALIGGMDSPLGVLPGALAVATVEVIIGQFLDPILLNVVPFMLALAILWIRPWGLFGTHEEVDRV